MKSTRFGFRIGIHPRAGFTLIELVIVLIIGGVLASIAVPNFANMRKEKNALNARDTFAWMAARARARALEMGTAYLLELDPAAERAWIVLRRTSGPAQPSDTVQTINFASEFDAQVSTGNNAMVTWCYSTRGYAWRCDNRSPTANLDVTFTSINKTAVARVKVLGSIERL